MGPGYYLILGVTADAKDEETHNAYRRLVQMIHPPGCIGS
jgi:DnaJ-class molecular chaperone